MMGDKKHKEDVNQAAYRILREATGEIPHTDPPPPIKIKNAAAAELGRLGGLKRAQNMPKDVLSDIGKKAAAKRWATAEPPGKPKKKAKI